VQFHPESVETPAGSALIERFLEAIEPRVLRRRLPGPFEAEAVFVELYTEEMDSFWLDGSTTYLGTGTPSALRPLPRAAGARQALPGGYVGCLSYEGESLWLYVDRVLAITDGDIELRALDGPGSREWIESTATALNTLRNVAHRPAVRQVEAASARHARAKADYLADIAVCKEYLARGESYEICLTNRLFLEPVSSPLELHREVRRRTPSPRSAYIAFDGLTICSATPETFLRVQPDGVITARPIKGTAPRHPDTAEDTRIAAELATSGKTRAENLMIVDLLRNDLNRVCQPGSVEVPRYMEVESYATVHQLVSTVTGRLRAGVTAVDALHAAFPPGSMTGAPKERTVAILAELEQEPRGVYSGVLGVLGADGSADLSVVIRTMVCTSQEVSIGVGGAIVWDSDPEDEYAEAMLKAKALLEAYAAVRAATPDGIASPRPPAIPLARKAFHGRRDEDRWAASGRRAQAGACVPSERAQGGRDPSWPRHDPGRGRLG
jgi:para-aminobenzoate synthetase